MEGCGAGGSTWDIAAVDDDVIGESSLAACSVSSSKSIITIVDVLFQLDLEGWLVVLGRELGIEWDRRVLFLRLRW